MSWETSSPETRASSWTEGTDMDRKISIAVLVSGGGTNLQALLDAQARGDLPSGHIDLVISRAPGAYALTRAREAGVPAVTVGRKGRSQEAFEALLLSTLREHGAELLILAGFLCILSENFVRNYPKRIINVHPSLIPAFCGAGYYGLRVHEAALDYGVKLTGATVHYVNQIPDGGEILLQKAVAVQEGDTPETLQRRVMEQAEWQLLPQAAELVCRRLLAEKTGNEKGQASET